MSAPLSREEILFHQRLMRQDGLYDGALDGLWGPLTDAADEERQLRLPPWEFENARTIATVSGLALRAVSAARAAVDAILEGSDLRLVLISGTRTYPEQSFLFRQGRYGNPGRVVTNARAGQSYHNFGIAFDVGLFREDGSYIHDSADPYLEARRLVMEKLGGRLSIIEWDLPHYHLKLPYGIAEVRRRFELGVPW